MSKNYSRTSNFNAWEASDEIESGLQRMLLEDRREGMSNSEYKRRFASVPDLAKAIVEDRANN